jgi:hypothetical protein
MPRYDHTLTTERSEAAIGTSVLSFGGLDEYNNPCGQLQRIQVKSDGSEMRCEMLECMNSCAARHAHAAALWREQLVVVGGVGEKMIGIDELICVLDLQSLVWSAVAGVGLGINPFWLNHTILSIGDAILILGGGANCFAFGALFNEVSSELRLTPFKK